jgi:hypothetical protein
MSAWNKKWHIQSLRIGDFDAVSLYPSAIARLYVATGNPIVIPKNLIDTDEQIKNEISDFKKYNHAADNITRLYKLLQNITKVTDYFVENEITKIKKKYPFSQVMYKLDSGKKIQMKLE